MAVDRNMIAREHLLIADDLLALTMVLGNILRQRGWLMATAESCTGGLLAGVCTAQPGSSDWFSGGIVSYADEAKTKLLDVPPTLLATHGAVSAEVAQAMALGALSRLEVQLALSITGVAGPSGGSATKPVGTVWLGAAWLEAPTRPPKLSSTAHLAWPIARTQRLCLSGDRQTIRAATVTAALHLLISIARGESP